jgi:hypothetical protein
MQVNLSVVEEIFKWLYFCHLEHTLEAHFQAFIYFVPISRGVILQEVRIHLEAFS